MTRFPPTPWISGEMLISAWSSLGFSRLAAIADEMFVHNAANEMASARLVRVAFIAYAPFVT